MEKVHKLTIFFLLLYFSCSNNHKEVLAEINGDIISLSGFKNKYQDFLLQKYQNDNLSNRYLYLNNLIDEKLILNYAKENELENDSVYIKKTKEVYDQLLLKAPIASPTFTGTVSGINKVMVGLPNVNNTSDLNKPISFATQTALALKEDAANKSVETSLGDSDVLYPSQKAVKTYVDATVASCAPDATDSSKGLIQLTGDLAGTLDNPTVPGLADKMSYPSAAGSNGEVLTTDGSNGLAWAASTDDQTADEVISSAVGNIIAEDVDAAIAELEAEKLALAGGTMSGNVAMGSNDISGALSEENESFLLSFDISL